MKRPPLFATLALLGLLAACSAAGSAADGARASGRQANLITQEEIRQAPPAQTAYDLIRALRPNWLQPRGVQSLGSPAETQPGVRQATRGPASVVVYIDGVRMGGPDALRQIVAANVREARFLGATEASTRFGTDHPAGAILITLQRG